MEDYSDRASWKLDVQKYWNDYATNAINGLRYIGKRILRPEELENLMWHDTTDVLFFRRTWDKDDKKILMAFASQDDEGNGAGFLNINGDLKVGAAFTARYLTEAERINLGFHCKSAVLESDSCSIIVQRDPEGNDGGSLFIQGFDGEDLSLPVI